MFCIKYSIGSGIKKLDTLLESDYREDIITLLSKCMSELDKSKDALKRRETISFNNKANTSSNERNSYTLLSQNLVLSASLQTPTSKMEAVQRGKAVDELSLFFGDL